MTKLFSYSIRVCLLIWSFIFCVSVSAEMYKWVDENGDTHYSQSRPISDVKVETIPPPSTVDTEGANKVLQEQKKKVNKLRDDRIAAADKQKKAEEDAANKKKECEMARKRLASYQRPRVNILNEDGSQRTIPEEERQAEIKKSQDSIDKVCN